MSWSCSRCETINPDTVDVCEVCDTERTAKRTHSTSSRPPKKEYSSAVTMVKSSESPPKPSPLAWLLAVVFGVASFILLMTNSSQSQELQSIRWQLNDAQEQLNSQVDVDSAVASAEANLRATILGHNYYRVTLTDFYNMKTYPINNVNGEQIGELYVTYGWAYMENDVPIDSKSLTTVRIYLNIYNDSTVGYYGFTNNLDDRYDVEERHIPSIGSTYTAETENYKMAIRVIEAEENQSDYGFNSLIVDVVLSNK